VTYKLGMRPPHYRGGLGQLNNLRQQAGSGEPLLLVDGLGFVWGQWVIVNIDETQSYLQSNGQALKQTFQLQLKYYGDDT
jgi:phage protein U